MSGRSMVVAIVALLVVSACNGDDSATTTATTTPVTVTTAGTGAITAPTEIPGGTTPATTVGDTVTTTTTLPVGLPPYTIRARTDDDTLVVLIEPGTYGDLDLQNVVADVVERFAPVTGLHLVDDEGAVEPVLRPEEEWTEDERALLDEHYFLRLEEGFRIVFVGPFADVGEAILGS